jgi:L-ascorbate metabolism protein UlaG (beta-lactamase superfamily)
MKIRWLSHACFEITGTPDASVTKEAVAERQRDITFLIDPYFSGNSTAPKYKGSPDFILITHEHFDHTDAGSFSCDVIATPSVVIEGVHPKVMKVGERMKIAGIEVEMIKSSHRQSKYPAGFVISMEGKRLYHPGDTYLDGVKDVLDKVKGVDIFFVPIGGTYTMDVDEAVEAVKLVKPNLAIPMHYSTFPQIKADAEEFRSKATAAGVNVKVLSTGEEMDY